MRILSVMVSVVLIIGCGEDDVSGPDGGSCNYTEILGVAVITSIQEPDSGSYNCMNGVKVLFDFTPGDPTAPQRYRFSEWPDTGQSLTVGAGANPAIEWVTSKNITAGNRYRCFRREITTGTCTPVLFEFKTIDFSDWADYCF